MNGPARKTRHPRLSSHVSRFAIIFALLPVFFLNCGRQGPRAYGKSGDGWIGVYVQDIDKELRSYLNLKSSRGVLVNSVVADSPADDAGLQEEDVIIRFDGKPVRNTRRLTRAVRKAAPGEKVKMEILRDEKKKKLTIRIGERPQNYTRERHRWPGAPIPPRSFSFHLSRPSLGIHTADLNDDLAEYFDMDESEGVLILSVAEDSPAEDAGLKAGDVILKLADERIRDREDLLEALAELDEDEKVEIEIKRNGKNKKLSVEIDDEHSYHFDRENLKGLKDDLREWRHDLNEWRFHFDRDEIEDEIRARLELDPPLK
ncbi:MAG: PDZ domain-containing protein [bacterium]